MDNNGWITDKEPDSTDAGNQMVWVWEQYEGTEYSALCDYLDVRLGTPWQPIIEPPPYVKQRWKPKKGEEYWGCSTDSIFCLVCSNSKLDSQFYERGNCFQTKEKAEEAFEKITQLLKEHHDGR